MWIKIRIHQHLWIHRTRWIIKNAEPAESIESAESVESAKSTESIWIRILKIPLLKDMYYCIGLLPNKLNKRLVWNLLHE